MTTLRPGTWRLPGWLRVTLKSAEVWATALVLADGPRGLGPAGRTFSLPPTRSPGTSPSSPGSLRRICSTTDAAETIWPREGRIAEYRMLTVAVQVGHYTQMVWSSSHKLGCGFAKCVGSDNPWGKYYAYICNYCPPWVKFLTKKIISSLWLSLIFQRELPQQYRAAIQAGKALQQLQGELW